jgi:hypothetical protein
MNLPVNFSTPPGKEPHRFFRNLCIEFKKLLQSSKDLTKLEAVMGDFLNASKEMNWHNKNTGVYHKAEGDKIVSKVWNEFKRYTLTLQSGTQADPEFVLTAIDDAISLINAMKVT